MKKMTIRFFLFSLLVLYLPAVSVAQTSSLDEQTITLSKSNVNMVELLEELSSTLPYEFIYKASDLPQGKRDINWDDENLLSGLQALVKPFGISVIKYRDYGIALIPDKILNNNYDASFFAAKDNVKKRNANAQSSGEESSQELAIGDPSNLSPNGRASSVITILDKVDNEPIIGANVIFEDGSGDQTDIDGKIKKDFSIGKHTLTISYIGYDTKVVNFQVYNDGDLTIPLGKKELYLDQVVITGESIDANVSNANVGRENLTVEQISSVPQLLGEVNVVQTLLTLPGITSVGEGSSGFNVRGGDADQNLVLLDDAIVFNPSHAVGFFSALNPHIIQELNLYKGNIPANFGGRLASVLDIQSRQTPPEDLFFNLGIGPMSSHLDFDVPIVKGKAAIMGGVRASYADLILKQLDKQELKNSSVQFNDATIKMPIALGSKNKLSFLFHFSNDDFVYNKEFGFKYQSLLGGVNLNSRIGKKWNNKLSFNYSTYDADREEFAGPFSSVISNNISYLKGKERLQYFFGRNSKVEAGVSGILYTNTLGNQKPLEAESVVQTVNIEPEKGLEMAGFANVDWSPVEYLTVIAGVRYSNYRYLGPKTTYNYQNPEYPLWNELVDSTTYGANESIQQYSGFEPRISARLNFTKSSSIKLGYSRTYQYLNQLFDSDAPTPSSIWFLSNQHVKPTSSHNLSFGYFQNFDSNKWEASLEFYGRDVDHVVAYKDFAQLYANPHLETEILNGVGRAYGAELSVKKNEGIWKGNFNYTYSRSEKLIEGINRGDWFPSNFDRPHNASFIVHYEPSVRHKLSFNFIYSTGRPTNTPIASYQTPDKQWVPIYARRNQVRIPDYHRLDVSYTVGRGYKKNKRFRTSYTFSVYNVYARQNAFSVFYTQGIFGKNVANKLSILGTAIPSFTLNIEFK